MEKNKPLLKLRHIHQIYTSGSLLFKM